MISLAMPTYNGAKYLKEQLDSIYNQTIVPDEVIVVDDCSSDSTLLILEEYKTKYGLKYCVNDSNIGYNKNFEKAIALCGGDYIALCDQDDIWLPTKIEKSYVRIKDFPVDVPALVASFSSPDRDVLIHPEKYVCKGGDWRHCFLLYYSQGCTLFFNKRLKEKILPLPDGVMYDSHIGLSAALIGNMAYIGEKLMYYRIHDNNAFQTPKRNGLFRMFVDNMHKRIPLLQNDKRLYSLLAVKERFETEANPSHLAYLNKVLSLYSVNKCKRLQIVWSIKEISFMRRVIIIFMLSLKVVLKIGE